MNFWVGNYYRRDTHKEAFTVSKLRSLYATLLHEIAPPHEYELPLCQTEVEDDEMLQEEVTTTISSSFSPKSSSNDVTGGNVKNFRKRFDSVLQESWNEMEKHHQELEDQNNKQHSHTIMDETISFPCNYLETDNNNHQHHHHNTIMSTSSPKTVKTTCSNDYESKTNYKSMAVWTAWRKLSAMTSPDTIVGGALSIVRNDDMVAELSQARAVESQVVELIRSMGEVIVYGEQNQDGIKIVGGTNNDAVFEYFCDKNILALFVDIAKAKSHYCDVHFFNLKNKSHHTTQQQQQRQRQSYNGVVWTASVKAQILQTVSFLLCNVQDPKSLYYLLSNNYVNELICTFVPLRQWTQHALEEIVPVYVNFLKTLTLQLARTPYLFQFYNTGTNSTNSHSSFNSTPLPTFPLLCAAVEVATSHYAQTDSLVHTTALNILLNIYQIPNNEIQNTIHENAFIEQRLFISHLCHFLLLKTYDNLCQLLTGPKVDIARSEALSAALTSFQDQLHFINDLLWCNFQSMNVQLCEYILRWVLHSHILPNLLLMKTSHNTKKKPNQQTKPITLRSEEEAKSLSSIIFLTQLFVILDYVPLLRMVAVSIFHPFSPGETTMQKVNQTESSQEYFLTSALNSIAQNHVYILEESGNQSQEEEQKDHVKVEDIELQNVSLDKSEDDEEDETYEELSGTRKSFGRSPSASSLHDIDDNNQTGAIYVSPNPFRQQILSLLQGNAGYEDFIPASMLLEITLTTKALDNAILRKLHILPDFERATKDTKSSTLMAGDEILVPSEFENALAIFFDRDFDSSSASYILSLECAISLSLNLLNHLIQCITEGWTSFNTFSERFCASSLIQALVYAKKRVASKAICLRNDPGVCDLFSDLVEMEIKRRFSIYTKDNNRNTDDQQSNNTEAIYFDLKENCVRTLNDKADVFIQKIEEVSTNEVEDAKFAIRLVISFHLLCTNLLDCHETLSSVIGPGSLGSSPKRWSQDQSCFKVSSTCVVDEDIVEIGGLKEQADRGTDLDVQGRTFFYFLPPSNMEERFRPRGLVEESKGSPLNDKERKKNFTKRTKANSELMMVIDPTELFIVKPNFRKNIHRGTILCSAPLRCVIATAPDDEWLHIAMRRVQDVGVLIKNGMF